jgi:hypothetical protein
MRPRSAPSQILSERLELGALVGRETSEELNRRRRGAFLSSRQIELAGDGSEQARQ